MLKTKNYQQRSNSYSDKLLERGVPNKSLKLELKLVLITDEAISMQRKLDISIRYVPAGIFL